MVQRMMRGEGADEDVNAATPMQGSDHQSDPPDPPSPDPVQSESELIQPQAAVPQPDSMQQSGSRPEASDSHLEAAGWQKVEDQSQLSPQEQAQRAQQQLEASREAARTAWGSSTRPANQQGDEAALSLQNGSASLQQDAGRSVAEREPSSVEASGQIRGPSPVEDLPVSMPSPATTDADDAVTEEADGRLTSTNEHDSSLLQSAEMPRPYTAEGVQQLPPEPAAEPASRDPAHASPLPAQLGPAQPLEASTALPDQPSATSTSEPAQPSPASALSPAEKAREAARATGSLSRRPWLQQQQQPGSSTPASAPTPATQQPASSPLSQSRLTRSASSSSDAIRSAFKKPMKQPAFKPASPKANAATVQPLVMPALAAESQPAPAASSSIGNMQEQQQAESLRLAGSNPALMPELQTVLSGQQAEASAAPARSFPQVGEPAHLVTCSGSACTERLSTFSNAHPSNQSVLATYAFAAVMNGRPVSC